MAPQKLDLKNQKATTKGTKASTRAGVVKRRYQKVRFHENGLLNVERKTGKYLKIARQNQRGSPLLRLPPELRHLIFKYVLGGKTFKIRYDQQKSIAKNTTVSKHALALLTVCRQIFAETTLLPFSSNTFSALHPLVVNMWIESFRPAFAEVIMSVRIDLSILRYPSGIWHNRSHGVPLSRYIALWNDSNRLSFTFTSLKCVKLAVTILKTRRLVNSDMEDVKREEGYIRRLYESANSGIKFTLTRTKR